jgi:foldase protein PrsA
MLRNKMKTARPAVIVLLALVLVLALAGCGKKDAKTATGTATGTAAATGKPTDVLATYKDNGTITRGDFDTFISINKMFSPQFAQYASDPAFQQDMLKQLIAMKVLAARADASVKADSDKQVASQMDQFKSYFGAMQGGLDKQLKDNNLKESDIQDFLKMSAYGINGLKSKVTDDEAKKSYDDKLKADPHAYDIATVDHILIGLKDAATQKDLRTKDEALARAKEVKAKLDKGGDFAALAKEYSDDPGSKDNGGQYKDADITQWVTGFKEAAATLPIGKISDPVETEYGYHVMKVESRKTKTFDEVKDSLKSSIAENDAYTFMDKELPGLILTNNLPKPPAGDKDPATGTAPGAAADPNAATPAAPADPNAATPAQPATK